MVQYLEVRLGKLKTQGAMGRALLAPPMTRQLGMATGSKFGPMVRNMKDIGEIMLLKVEECFITWTGTFMMVRYSLFY